MREVSATEAARQFSDLLDAVEHGHETLAISRGGRFIAVISPAPAASGSASKAVFRAARPDDGWATDVRAVRRLLSTEERTWPD